MPIKPEFRHLYGAAWRLTRQRILDRAHDRCERCGKPNHALIWTYTWQTCDLVMGGERHYHMAWCQAGTLEWRDQNGSRCFAPRNRGNARVIRVKLTVAHQDHHPPNMADENLRCWCTWCHLHHDQDQHRETRCIRKDAMRPLLEASL